jgi:SAM-dependent methyltransferase
MQTPLLEAADSDITNFASPLINRLESEDRPFHDWYRFVLSFPAHIVREYLADRFQLRPGQAVLDPFCGTGTTIVEARLLGYEAYGIEANPMAHFASRLKATADANPRELRRWALQIVDDADQKIRRARSFRSLKPEADELLLADCIGKVPLHKILMLREVIEESDNTRLKEYGMLALAKCAVQTASNLHFGPEVGVKGRKLDAPVVDAWFRNIQQMATDIESVENEQLLPSHVFRADARNIGDFIEPNSIEGVFTSPPYPNEKDYTRTTRLESVLLRFLNNKAELRELKQDLIRSNTRNVYKADTDHAHVADNDRINEIADTIEKRRLELGKTSGFEKLYGRLTKLYFGGMARHLAAMRPLLRPGARLGYVVGDQASYLQVHIPTGSILADIATTLDYRHVRTDLFRTRLATSTKQQMREEVLVLEWEG